MTQIGSNSSNSKDEMLEKVLINDSDDIIDIEIQQESIVNMDHNFLSVNKLDWYINQQGNLMHGGTFL